MQAASLDVLVSSSSSPQYLSNALRALKVALNMLMFYFVGAAAQQLPRGAR